MKDKRKNQPNQISKQVLLSLSAEILITIVAITCLFLIVSTLKITDPPSDEELVQIFTDAFNDPACDNPCWMGIEVGITTRAEAKTLLEEQGIAFAQYEGSELIYLYELNNTIVPGLNLNKVSLGPDGKPLRTVYGDINPEGGGTVGSMDFALDLCVTTIFRAYGEPTGTRGSTMVYVEEQLYFSWDASAGNRVDVIFLHQEIKLPIEELQDWRTFYGDVISEPCTDQFTSP